MLSGRASGNPRVWPQHEVVCYKNYTYLVQIQWMYLIFFGTNLVSVLHSFGISFGTALVGIFALNCQIYNVNFNTHHLVSACRKINSVLVSGVVGTVDICMVIRPIGSWSFCHLFCFRCTCYLCSSQPHQIFLICPCRVFSCSTNHSHFHILLPHLFVADKVVSAVHMIVDNDSG